MTKPLGEKFDMQEEKLRDHYSKIPTDKLENWTLKHLGKPPIQQVIDYQAFLIDRMIEWHFEGIGTGLRGPKPIPSDLRFFPKDEPEEPKQTADFREPLITDRLKALLQASSRLDLIEEIESLVPEMLTIDDLVKLLNQFDPKTPLWMATENEGPIPFLRLENPTKSDLRANPEMSATDIILFGGITQ